jgi:S-DNA-T family DNA segregation ATPase FtsK/SpoIIIE
VHLLDRWRRVAEPPTAPGESGLARLVAAVRAAARARGSAPARSPWRPPLPALLARAELGGPAGRGVLALGRVDLPDEQRQEDFTLDVAKQGSVLLTGAARSGRTTALVTLGVAAAERLSPAELHLHVIDASGDLARALRSLPHCATVLGPADLGLVSRLLARLDRAVAGRRVDVAAQPPATILLLVDGWHAACAALSDAEAAAATETLIMLLRSAPNVGLLVAVTGDGALLAPRFAGGFAERLLLRQADWRDGRPVGARGSETPPDMPPGRAVRMSDGALLQLAIAAERPEDIRAEVTAIAGCWPRVEERPSVIRVRPLPDHVRLGDLPAAPPRFRLGLAGDDPTPVLADPFAGPGRWLVAGPPRSGRTTLLRLLAAQAEATGRALLVAATETSPLLAEARSRGAAILRPADDWEPTPPTRPTLVLVDDTEAFSDTAVGAQLTAWARDRALPVAVVAAGRADELATSYRGVAAEVRRHRVGVLLRPGPLDGELFGLRIPRHPGTGPPGRGMAVADPSWGAAFADGGPVPIQVALP